MLVVLFPSHRERELDGKDPYYECHDLEVGVASGGGQRTFPRCILKGGTSPHEQCIGRQFSPQRMVPQRIAFPDSVQEHGKGVFVGMQQHAAGVVRLQRPDESQHRVSVVLCDGGGFHGQRPRRLGRRDEIYFVRRP